MAIQKWLYLKTEKINELKWISENYKQMKDPAYKRAWEIIDEIEDYEAFIREI